MSTFVSVCFSCLRWFFLFVSLFLPVSGQVCKKKAEAEQSTAGVALAAIKKDAFLMSLEPQRRTVA